MADVHDSNTRSRNMAAIRGKNTRPEILIRRGLHVRGLRFRLHVRNLPGRPDLVLPRWRLVLFVNGCFWHGHDCPMFRWPKTRPEFWRDKIGGNVVRDLTNEDALAAQGWRVGIIWECALKGPGRHNREELLDDIVTAIRDEPAGFVFQGKNAGVGRIIPQPGQSPQDTTDTRA